MVLKVQCRCEEENDMQWGICATPAPLVLLVRPGPAVRGIQTDIRTYTLSTQTTTHLILIALPFFVFPLGYLSFVQLFGSFWTLVVQSCENQTLTSVRQAVPKLQTCALLTYFCR